MAFTINTNVASMQAQEYLRTTGEFQAKTINRVTSGLRIINAGDDAAGLSIANSFRSDQAVLSQGIRNANDGLGTLQTIDSGISNIGKLLDRARTLATQAATGTFTGSLSVLDDEFQSVMGEIDRQSQAIGLDSNGTFAKELSVFIGGGRAGASSDQIKNGSVSIDLSKSTVDSQSLGMKGVQAGNTASHDLSTGKTNVQSIVIDTANVAGLATAGYTNFSFKGPGFGDSNGITVRVNVNNVASTEALEAAVNSAIAAAGTDPTAAAQSFKNSGIKAKIVTDSSGNQQLAFSSSSASFQVSGGDKMANALLGNFVDAADRGEGVNIVSTTTGVVGAAAGLGTFAGSQTLKMQFDGGGLTSPVELSHLTTAGETAAQVAADFKSQIAANATLRAAGITMSGASAVSGLEFSSASGQDVRVGVTGDVRNNLGMGAFKAGAANASEYNTITLAAGSTLRNNETSQFSFSFNGATAQSVSVTWSAGNLATGATMKTALNEAINVNPSLKLSGMTAEVDAVTKAITFSTPTTNNFRVQTSGGTGAGASQGVVAPNMVDGETTSVSFSVDGKAAESVNVAWVAGDLLGDPQKQSKVDSAIAAAITAGGGAGVSSLSGMTAVVSGSSIVFTKANLEVLSAYNGGMAGAAAGYTAPLPGGANTKGYVAAGSYQLGAAGAAAPLAFSAINFASDKQALTIQATDASGSNHKLDVTLNNVNAESLDEAINTINTKLQESNDSTLKGITAVKVIDGGVEKMTLVSTNKDFRLSIGINASGTGLNQTNTLVSSLKVGEGSNASILTQADAKAAVSALAKAVTTLGMAQAVVGKGQNQFNFAVSLASTQLTNLAASESRIRDADLALEAANLSKAQILTQAGVAAMAQANSAPQAVLSLLRG